MGGARVAVGAGGGGCTRRSQLRRPVEVGSLRRDLRLTWFGFLVCCGAAGNPTSPRTWVTSASPPATLLFASHGSNFISSFRSLSLAVSHFSPCRNGGP